MTTFNTIDEFLDILDSNPRLLEAVRNKILTEDLIRLPHEFSEFKETTGKHFDGLASDMKGMEERLTNQIGAVGKQIDGLGTRVDTELRAQSAFRGNYAQSAAINERIRIANKFAHLHGARRTDAMGVRRDVLKTWLQGEYTDVVEGLRLRERAWETFLVSDMVAAVQDLMAPNEDPPLYYIAVEASYSIDDEDVAKATDHAKIVQAVTGLTAYAVVAGVRLDDEITNDARNKIHEEVTQYVEASNPDFVYWHRLVSSDLRPPEPR